MNRLTVTAFVPAVSANHSSKLLRQYQHAIVNWPLSTWRIVQDPLTVFGIVPFVP